MSRRVTPPPGPSVSKRNAGRRGRSAQAPPGLRTAATAGRRRGERPSRPAAGGERAAPAPPGPRREQSGGRGRGSREAGATPDRSRRAPGRRRRTPAGAVAPVAALGAARSSSGAIGTIVGFSTRRRPPTLFAGLGAVVLGTLEFTIREHRSGYRSHAALLAAVPTALAARRRRARLVRARGASGDVLVVAPLLVDVPLFCVPLQAPARRVSTTRAASACSPGGARRSPAGRRAARE